MFSTSASILDKLEFNLLQYSERSCARITQVSRPNSSSWRRFDSKAVIHWVAVNKGVDSSTVNGVQYLPKVSYGRKYGDIVLYLFVVLYL